MDKFIYTYDGVFFSPLKEEVIRKEAELILEKLVEKSTISRGFGSGNVYDVDAEQIIKISYEDFKEAQKQIEEIRVDQFKQIS